ncbi:MAG: hypothetical protein ABIN48_10060 [Ginsengibacter sp.]
MKHITLIACLAIFMGTGCKKNKAKTELEKLPPITQTGANTFVCLVNGKAYIPNGNDGAYPNFRTIVDPANSIIDIRTFSYDFVSGVKSQIFFGSSISKSTGIFSFSNKGEVSLGIFKIMSCYIPSADSCYRKGNLIVSRYDLQNGIFSGEFECIIFGNNCTDTIRITNGRFDAKL